MRRPAPARLFPLPILLFFLAISHVKADVKKPDLKELRIELRKDWTWKDRDGRTHSPIELHDILLSHRLWVSSHGQAGSRAELPGADLSGADLFGADLSGANLSGANLADAFLGDANLVGAQLSGADLTGASVNGAKLGGGIFEPKSLPRVTQIAGAQNLELLRYYNVPVALVQLRNQFEDAGFREQERKITYALKRREAELSWQGCRSRQLASGKPRAILWSADSNAANCSSFILNRVFFDLTCEYGMSPGRPLSLGVLLWLLCSVVYFIYIHTSGEAGLYRIYRQGTGANDLARAQVRERISPRHNPRARGVRRVLHLFWSEWSVFRAAMFFSLMSAFNIGFRDLNFGRWLRLLTRQEFYIKAVGWARVVAGWQSLISVYFITLWVLTYFGRPFG